MGEAEAEAVSWDGWSTPVISTAHIQVHIPKWICFNLWNPAFVLGFLELVLREAAVSAH